MRFINCGYKDFVRNLGRKSIALFGASSAWDYFCEVFPTIENDLSDKVVCIVDNSKDKQGKTFQCLNHEYVVMNPSDLISIDDCVILIDVSLVYVSDICRQLLNMQLDQNVDCYSLFLMTCYHEKIDNTVVDKYFCNRNTKRIPPIIHSFWFSGEEKPDLYKRCIDSWYKYCSSFEILEWNAEKYDVSKNEYMYEAFQRKKWAFVSDYARLDVLKQFGGIYMDMDVELVASLEPLLYADGFFCRQDDGLLELGSGFGVPKNDELISRMLDEYEGRHLILTNGEMDMTAQPQFLSRVLREYGFEKNHNSQEISGKIVLSNEYISCFAGVSPVVEPKIGIHWHNGGWLDERSRKIIHDSNESRETLIKEIFID